MKMKKPKKKRSNFDKLTSIRVLGKKTIEFAFIDQGDSFQGFCFEQCKEHEEGKISVVFIDEEQFEKIKPNIFLNNHQNTGFAALVKKESEATIKIIRCFWWNMLGFEDDSEVVDRIVKYIQELDAQQKASEN